MLVSRGRTPDTRVPDDVCSQGLNRRVSTQNNAFPVPTYCFFQIIQNSHDEFPFLHPLPPIRAYHVPNYATIPTCHA